MAQSKTYLNYIHNFRGVAIIFVVGGHILYGWHDKSSIGYQIINSVFQNGTVLFIFIAGYLFQHLSRGFEYKSYLEKKVTNVLLPYLIVSLPILVMRLYSGAPDYLVEIEPDYAHWSVAHRCFWLLITGAHLLPLWFVPMITLFYLCAPLLLAIDRRPRYYWVLILLVIVSLLVPRKELENIPRMFIHFLSVYVFGMFCSHYKNELLEFSKRWWKPMTALTLVVVIVSLFKIPLYDQMMYVQKMLLCWFFIYWLWRWDAHVPKITGFLAEISFGIFFVHFYFVIGLRFVQERLLHIEIGEIVLYWSIQFIGVMVTTSVFIWVMQKIFGKRSRMLIGC